MRRSFLAVWNFWTNPWTTAVKVAIVIVLPGIVALVLGLTDVYSALSFTGRVEGAIDLVAGTLMMAGAVAVLLYQNGSSAGGPIASVAALAAALFAVLILFTAYVGGDARMDVVCSAVASLGTALWALARLLGTGVRISYPKVALAVLLPGLIAAANFIYSDLYLPSIEPRLTALTTSIGKSSKHDVEITTASATPQPGVPPTAVATLPLTIGFKNMSQHRVYVVGSGYSVTGRRSNLLHSDLSPASIQYVGQPLYERDTRIIGFDLLQAGEFIPPGSSVEAGSSVTIAELINLPLPVSYDQIEATTTIFLIAADKVTISASPLLAQCSSWDKNGVHCIPPRWVAHPAVYTVRFQAPLAEGTGMRRLTYNRRYVTSWFVLNKPSLSDPSGPYLDAAIATIGRESKPPTPEGYSRFTEEYGLQRKVISMQTSTAELGLLRQTVSPVGSTPTKSSKGRTPPGLYNEGSLAYTGLSMLPFLAAGLMLILGGVISSLVATKSLPRSRAIPVMSPRPDP